MVGGEARAKLVGVWKSAGIASGWFTEQMVYIHVQNGSDRRINNLVFSWRLGTAPWGDPQQVSYVMPGKTTRVHRRLPKDPSSEAIRDAYSADVFFQDDNKVYWCATPREDGGSFVKRAPDEEASPA